MKILFLLIVLRGAIFANTDSLPSRTDLFQSLRAFHVETDSANVEALRIPKAAEAVKKKYEWMHWMPSVGISFGKPSISFSLGQVAANIEGKALRKAAADELEFTREAERRKILRGGVLAFRSDSFALVALLQRHDMFLASLPRLKAAEQIEADKLRVQRQRDANGDVKPLEWLNLKADSLRSGDPLRARLEEITLLEIDIRKMARY